MRILVVEDEHKIAQSIKKGLEQERYAVDVAYTGTDGLDLASTEDYDVVVLDMMLPEMDGMSICKELRSKNIHTPILILTARGQLHEKVDGLNAGADDYLTKPFAFEELLARIKALIRRPHQTTGANLVVDNLTVDTLTYNVERDGTQIQLSHKEFALLEYLMRHQEHVLTKDQIIHHVWNYDADVLPNTVEVYIGYLRNKVDKPFKENKKLIHTIRGFGYKIGVNI
ncbi:MAG: hypothetical protein RI947_1337 [Candidatus Parcubacteria bacterium]|jgi:DNA-binding response OmpR family regulator